MANDNIENPMIRGKITAHVMRGGVEPWDYVKCSKCDADVYVLDLYVGNLCKECQNNIEALAINVLIENVSIEDFAVLCEIWEIDKTKIKSEGAKL